MKVPVRTVMIVAALAPATGLAAEGAPQRELLQPPKHAIASPITDRFAIRGVYFRPSIETALRYDASNGTPGTLLSGERTLLLEDRVDQGWLDLMFRIGERHRIRAEYYQQVRTGDTVLGGEILFGDETYLAGDRVLSRTDLRKLDVAYTFSMLRYERFEAGLGLGIHLLQLEGSLNAPARFQRTQLDTAGPFPTLTADATWRITRGISLNGSVHFLHASTDEVDGRYLSWRADVQYRGFRNLAFGLGYALTHYKVDSTDPDESGYFDFRYDGPEVFLRVSF